MAKADLGKHSTRVLPSSQPPAAPRPSGKMPSITSVTQYVPLPWRRSLELRVPAGVAAVLHFCSHPQVVRQMPSPVPGCQWDCKPKKHRPQEVPIRSSTHGADLQAAPGVPPFSAVPTSRVPKDRLTRWAGIPGCPMGSSLPLSWPVGPVLQRRGQKPDRSFFSTGNAPCSWERYPKWLLTHVYSLPESELIQRQLVYAID